MPRSKHTCDFVKCHALDDIRLQILGQWRKGPCGLFFLSPWDSPPSPGKSAGGHGEREDKGEREEHEKPLVCGFHVAGKHLAEGVARVNGGYCTTESHIHHFGPVVLEVLVGNVGRICEDSLQFMAEHPELPVTAMDTVVDRKGGKVFLTLFFMPYDFMPTCLLGRKCFAAVAEVFGDIRRWLARRRTGSCSDTAYPSS